MIKKVIIMKNVDKKCKSIKRIYENKRGDKLLSWGVSKKAG